MSGRLQDRVALITGGGDGIGWGVAAQMLRAGAYVMIAERDPCRSERALADARAAGYRERVAAIACDATCETQVQQAIAATAERFGGLDIMVNNVGGPGDALGPIAQTPPSSFDAVIALTLRSAYLGIHFAARHMIAQARGGVILSTASISAYAGGAGPPIYSAAKAALVRLSHNAAAELAPYGIRVNTLSPGLILTPTFEASGATPAFAASLQPLAEAGRPVHVGDAAVFLASDEARFIAGSDLVVDGAALADGLGLWKKLLGGGAS